GRTRRSRFARCTPESAGALRFVRERRPAHPREELPVVPRRDAAGPARSAQPRERAEGRRARLGHRAGRRGRKPVVSAHRGHRAAGEAATAGPAAAGTRGGDKEGDETGGGGGGEGARAHGAAGGGARRNRATTDYSGRTPLLGVQPAGESRAPGR